MASEPKAIRGKKGKPGASFPAQNTSGEEFNASAQGSKAALANMKKTQSNLSAGPKQRKSNRDVPTSPDIY